MDERQRIANVYADRAELVPPGYYSPFDPGNSYITQQRERATLDLLRDHGLTDLGAMRVLEVGCGNGAELLRLIQWGAVEGQVAGVDVLLDRVDAARSLLPRADIRVADGRELPFPDAGFDLVTQLTVFSSVLDPAIRLAIAGEMRRVLKPGGAILWFDMRVVRPDRPLAAMPEREIRRLFPGCRIACRSAVLNPMISRRVAKVSRLLCDILTLLPIARSHYVALVRP